MSPINYNLSQLNYYDPAAALVHNFDVCTGIEILEELHKGSLDVATIYDTKVRVL